MVAFRPPHEITVLLPPATLLRQPRHPRLNAPRQSIPRTAADRATPGRPGDLSFLRRARSERRRPAIAPSLKVLRRSVESTQYTSEQFQKLLADHDVTCSMSRSGNVWDQLPWRASSPR